VKSDGGVVSAAGVPYEVQAVANRFQDWPRWLADGHLDVLCPMAYTTEVKTFRAQIDQAVSRGGPRGVWAGIGAWRQNLNEVAEKVRQRGPPGRQESCCSRTKSLRELDPASLRRELFASPEGGSGRSAGALVGPAQTN